MEFNDKTPRVSRTIGGRLCKVIAPFAAGQPLTDATAAMLNQTFAENISNNTRAKIDAGPLGSDGKPTGKKFSDAEVQKIVDDYTAEYEPGVRGGGRSMDPAEREARKLARAEVIKLVKAQNMKQADVDLAGLTDKLFEKNRDKLLAEGARIVEAMNKASTDGLDLGISLTD